jgi:hypothetical protein
MRRVCPYYASPEPQKVAKGKMHNTQPPNLTGDSTADTVTADLTDARCSPKAPPHVPEGLEI